MNQKSNNKSIVLIVFLIIIIMGLIIYILFDKGIVKFGDAVVESDQEETIKNEIKDEKPVELSLDNSTILELYDASHYRVSSPDRNVYGSDGITVDKMDVNYKFSLAFNNISETQGVDVLPDGREIFYYSESAIKVAYEKLFGPNTYKQVDKFSACGTYTYDSSKQRYTSESFGCGGDNPLHIEEVVIKALRYSDRIEVVSAVVYAEGIEKKLYKDIDLSESIGTYSDMKELKAYVTTNKDKLEQYTYTYKLSDDGFYYYYSVARTKK